MKNFLLNKKEVIRYSLEFSRIHQLLMNEGKGMKGIMVFEIARDEDIQMADND